MVKASIYQHRCLDIFQGVPEGSVLGPLLLNLFLCDLLLFVEKADIYNIDNEVIKNSNNKKLLGINLNNRLGFDTHITNICNRVSKKLHALARISQFMNIHKQRITMKAFIASEFGYCPLV